MKKILLFALLIGCCAVSSSFGMPREKQRQKKVKVEQCEGLSESEREACFCYLGVRKLSS